MQDLKVICAIEKLKKRTSHLAAPSECMGESMNDYVPNFVRPRNILQQDTKQTMLEREREITRFKILKN